MQNQPRPPLPPGFDQPRFDFLYFAILSGLILSAVGASQKWCQRILKILFSARRHPP